MTPKPRLILLLVKIMLITSIFGLDNHTLELAVRVFKAFNTNNVLLSTCSSNESSREVIGKFSSEGFQSTNLEKENVSIMERQLTSTQIIGVLVEANCPSAEILLRLASKKKFFNSRRAWLILLPTSVTQSELEDAFKNSEPPMFNITEYFLMEYETVKNRERLEKINTEINGKLLDELAQEQKTAEGKAAEIPEMLKLFTELEALVDSEVTLAIPSATGAPHDLYAIHRKTNHSAMDVEKIATANDDYRQLNKLKPSAVRRRNFHRTVLRAGCGLFYLAYFNRSDELTTSYLDIWAQMTFTHLKLIEESLNFRMLVKCFDDYGWPTDGPLSPWNGLVGFMQRHNAEITATGLILRNDRMNVLDYVDATFEFKLGLIFRQPNLASVSNIFVLPFSRTVWVALGGLLLVAYVIISFQIRVEQWLHSNKQSVSVSDVFNFITGVVCQQGHHLGVETIGVRVSILVVLISSLFLFTAYTATIVALLQSPASLINSVKDFAESALKIGIEDLPYEHKFFEEDDDGTISEIYRKKVIPEGDEAYLNTSQGVHHVRQGFYAFQCELSNGYKLIQETYDDHEKCGLKKLDLFPSKVLGPAVTKASPYKEILIGRLRWLREVGITHRTVQRWSHRKPPCESSHSSFSSVGLGDIRPLILVFTYGLIISLILMLVECLAHPRGSLRKLLQKCPKNVEVFKFSRQKKQPKQPVWQFTN